MAPLLCLPNYSFNFYLFIVIIDPSTKKMPFFCYQTTLRFWTRLGFGLQCGWAFKTKSINFYREVISDIHVHTRDGSNIIYQAPASGPVVIWGFGRCFEAPNTVAAHRGHWTSNPRSGRRCKGPNRLLPDDRTTLRLPWAKPPTCSWPPGMWPWHLLCNTPKFTLGAK